MVKRTISSLLMIITIVGLLISLSYCDNVYASSDKQYVAGVLKEYDLNFFTITVDTNKYDVTDDFSFSDAQKYLNKNVVIELIDNKANSIIRNYTKDNADEYESITKTDIVESVSYGVAKYKKTAEGIILDELDDYGKSMYEYVKAVRDEANKDVKKLEKEDSSTVEMLRKIDETTNDRFINMPLGTPEPVMRAVYEAFAEYMNMYVYKGEELRKIDFSKNEVEVSTRIVQKICNSLDTLNFPENGFYSYGQYKIKFNVTQFRGAFTGSIIVNGKGKSYTGVINSSLEHTTKIMNEYINDIAELSEAALKVALYSAIYELNQVTGFTDLIGKEYNNLLSEEVQYLQQKGYGDVMKKILQLKDDAEVINDLLSIFNSEDLKLEFKDINKLYEQLKKNGNYSDSSVANRYVKGALDKTSRLKRELLQAIDGYISDPDNWTTKSPLDVWIEKHSDAWLFKIKCPVEVEVINSDGKVVGISSDFINTHESSIYTESNGNSKSVYVPKNFSGKLKFIPIADGTMNYVIEEIKDGEKIGRMNFYDIPLDEGKEFTQNIPSSEMSGDISSYALTVESSKKFYPNEYVKSDDTEAFVKVDFLVDDGGKVRGERYYAKGDTVELTAVPENNQYIFIGWYMGDDYVESSTTYRFTAVNNITVKAKFKKIKLRDNSYKLILGEKYYGVAGTDIYKSDSNLDDIRINLGGISDINVGLVTMKRFDLNDNLQDKVNVNTIYDDSILWIKNIALDNKSYIVLYDGSGDIVISVIYAGLIEHSATISDIGKLYFDEKNNNLFEYDLNTAERIIYLKGCYSRNRQDDIIIPALVKLEDRVYSVRIQKERNEKAFFNYESSVFFFKLESKSYNLQSVKFVPVFNQKIVSDEYGLYAMFYRCESISEIDLSGLEACNSLSMVGMFSGCRNLTNLNLDGLNTSKVCNMKNMFSGCSSIEKVDVSGFDTSNVTDMSGMFEYCRTLQRLDLSNFKTQKVTNMSDMFMDCNNIQTINVANFNTSNVENMYGMFSGCNYLTEVDMSSFDASKVTNMERMFYGCEKLSIADLSGFNAKKIENIKDMFFWCDSLKKIDLSTFDFQNYNAEGSSYIGGQLLSELITPSNMGTAILELSKDGFIDSDGQIYKSLDSSTPTKTRLLRRYKIECNFGFASNWNAIIAKENPQIPQIQYYTIETNDIMIKSPSTDGYSFIGWTGSELEEPSMFVIVHKGTIGDLKYTANWVDNSESNYIDDENKDNHTIINIRSGILSGVKSTYLYVGKDIKPSIRLSCLGKRLTTADYSVSYKNNKNVGTATITIMGKGNYTGKLTKTFKILPKVTSLLKITPQKGMMTINWKKQITQVTGYEVQYSLKKNMKSATTKIVKKNKIASLKVSKLKSKKIYYVRVRTYKTVSGKKYYSAWSEVKGTKVK